MHPSLKQALDIISIERHAAEYTQAFDAVNEVVSVFGELDLANRLFAEIPRTVPEELVVELFNLLAWQTNDNGAAMTREVETWLREQHDPRKLRIAMSLMYIHFQMPKRCIKCCPRWLRLSQKSRQCARRS